MTLAIERNTTRIATAQDTEQSFYSRLIDSIKSAKARRARYRRTYEELCSLTNRELSDIGIGRGDIRRVARQHLIKENEHEYA